MSKGAGAKAGGDEGEHRCPGSPGERRDAASGRAPGQVMDLGDSDVGLVGSGEWLIAEVR